MAKNKILDFIQKNPLALPIAKRIFDKAKAAKAAQDTAEVDQPVGRLAGAELPSTLTAPYIHRQSGKPFNVLERYDPVGQIDIEDVDLEEPSFLSEISPTVKSLLSGEIPDDVIDATVRAASKANIASGRFGEAAEIVTLGALRNKSLELMSTGLEAGFKVADIQSQTARTRADIQSLAARTRADINARIEMSNQNNKVAYLTLQENIRQWEDNMRTRLMDQEISRDELDLRTAELMARHQQFGMDLVANLLAKNSSQEIAGIQNIVSNFETKTEDTVEAIRDMLGLTFQEVV